MLVTGTDNMIINVYPDISYDITGANILSSGANWYIRCKIDTGGSGIAITNSRPYPARLPSTSYSVGTAATFAGYVITCKTSGVTGSADPILKNSGIDITDGTVVWRYEVPVTNYGFRQVGAGVQENHLTQCDFSGLYSKSLQIDASGLAITVITDSVLNKGATINTGSGWTSITNCELAGSIDLITGYTGPVIVADNCAVAGAFDVNVQANVSNFNITNNYMAGGHVVVSAGTSDHYIVTGNFSSAVTDGGTGVNKYVVGNVA